MLPLPPSNLSENLMETFLDLLKYTIPALVVLIATAIIVNKFLITEIRKKQLTLFREGLKTTLSLRLQAYERLTVFLERIKPRSVFPRIYQHGMTVGEFQYAIIKSIKQEFDHNLSQQIYVSTKVWDTIVGAKEQQMAMINQISSSLKPTDSAKALHKLILDSYTKSSPEKLPINVALAILREEAKLVLSQKI